MNGFETHRLSNGLRILYIHQPQMVVTHCALMVKAGTRDEPEGLEGLAHYLEHCLFKGTTHRKSYHILNRLEVVGGELNAYTTKEETCLHASVMNEYLERAVELISDIVHHSVFPVAEIKKEKEVIRDEISTYLDTPSEQIFDDFEGQIFKGHPLGRSILGTTESLDRMSRADLLRFVKDRYRPEQMVFSVSGNAGLTAIVKLAEQYLGGKSKTAAQQERKKVGKTKATSLQVPKSVNQVHAVCGTPAYSLFHPDRTALVLLNNLLGGPGMNSRLNLNIREKYGFTYSVESGYHAYSDSGLFHVYFATDVKNADRTAELVEKELQKLMDTRLSERVFSQYREQMLGQLTLSQENRLSLMLSQTKALLYFGKTLPFSELREKIKAVTAEKLQAVAGDIFNPAVRSYLSYRPSDAKSTKL